MKIPRGKSKKVKTENDDIEQYSHRMCLRISVLKEFDHEDVTAKVLSECYYFR